LLQLPQLPGKPVSSSPARLGLNKDACQKILSDN
jgi:hypothetical protein